MNNSEKNIHNALILAAGLSKRMGKSKMLLQYDETRTFLEVIIEQYISFGCSKVVVVINEYESRIDNITKTGNNVEIIVNRRPEWGRFYSIWLGLHALKNKGSVFIHNVDNPFLFQTVLNNMLKKLYANSYVVPTFNAKGGHPVLISKQIVNSIILQNDFSYNFKEYLQNFTRFNVSVKQKEILTNINTLKQYDNFKNNRFRKNIRK